MSTEEIVAFAPGRVNLIGEHTDYTGGLVLPMALDLGVTVRGTPGGDRVVLDSEQLGTSSSFAVPVADLPTEPSWARYVAAAARAVDAGGFRGRITSTLPAGGTGLSSSSALTVAALVAFGALEPDTVDRRKELAEIARLAEAEASGVQSGIMDQLISLVAVEGHATMIDCHTLELTPVSLPSDLEVVVFHSGQPRQLADSEYNDRRAACETIEARIGPLRVATIDAVAELDDPVLARRARHVIEENQRVRDFAAAAEAGDVAGLGRLLEEGHRSLSELYETSTPIVDAIQAHVAARPGVHGARMVGGGFGGALVALVDPGTVLDVDTWTLRVAPGAGAGLRT